MIVNKMEKATEYTEFTEKKDISSEFCPSGAAGPHPPDLSGVLSVAKKSKAPRFAAAKSRPTKACPERSRRGGFTPLEAIPADRPASFRYGFLTAFTLLEILIAVAIIAVIVSMVYGSYFAAARSTEAYDATMEVSEQARQVLVQMARQIRCTYAPQSVHRVEQMQQASGTLGQSLPPEKLILRNETLAEKVPNYFTGGVDGPAGEVLQLVTTDGSSAGPQLSNGLFEVIYRFDKSSRLLSLSQERFIERLQSPAGHRNWQPVLTGVERFELTFYDGQKWLSKWDFKEKRRPPLATKVEITCEDKNNRRCRLATTAYVPCHKNQGKNMAADTLVSVDEKWD